MPLRFALPQERSQLHPLRFTAGKRIALLTELDIA